MRRMQRMALGVCLLLALSIPCLAQNPTTAGATGKGAQKGAGKANHAGHHGVALAHIPVSVLDAIVTLKGDQKTRIAAIQDKAKADATAAAGDRTKITAIYTTASNDIQGVLTADQQNKLMSMVPAVQALGRGKPPIIPLAVIPNLNLTSTQWNQIATAYQTETASLKGVPKEERKAKMQAALADYRTKVEAILTASQKTQISQYRPPRKKGQKGQTATASATPGK